MTDTITLWELRGILGKIPFSEDELIELIEDGRLNALEIANTSTKLLTIKIQKSLLYNDADAAYTLMRIYLNTENNNINLGYIIETDEDELDTLPKEQRMTFVNKYPESFKKI